MLSTEHRQKNIVAKIDARQEERIKDFIQGSVYSFCKNSSSNQFAARDLFGGTNRNWEGTPLQVLYNWHEQNESSNPQKMAAKDLGWLLLKVLRDDPNREFKPIKGYTLKYEWIKARSGDGSAVTRL